MKYLALIFALLVACAETELPPSDLPVAGSPDVGVVTPAFKCKLTVTTDVVQPLGALCVVVPTDPYDAWGQTLFEMYCSEPIYYWTGQRVSTGVRYDSAWSAWTEFSKPLSNRVGLHTLNALGQPKKVVNTTLCDVVIPSWVK